MLVTSIPMALAMITPKWKHQNMIMNMELADHIPRTENLILKYRQANDSSDTYAENPWSLNSGAIVYSPTAATTNNAAIITLLIYDIPYETPLLVRSEERRVGKEGR